MISAFASTRSEFYLRAVKDMYADFLVTLPELLDKNEERGLHLYFSNYSGLRKAMYPELRHAYDRWCDNRDISFLNTAVAQGLERYATDAAWSLELFRRQGLKAKNAIEARLDEIK